MTYHINLLLTWHFKYAKSYIATSFNRYFANQRN
uniref:Uncharacterized protein n=1 Tax=Arundo donax TaxID=35708 RepID=A0A0A9ALB0_ARUDO